MRKVYHQEGNGLRVPLAIAFSVGITAVIFGVLPFSHIIAKPGRNLELRKSTTADLPPPAEAEPPPPPTLPEPDVPPPAAPEPQLAEAPLPLALSADLDVAMGSGGALAGFGEVKTLAAAEAVQQEAFDVTELEKRPEAVSQVAPAYPPELRKARIEGTVTLMFVLTEEGRVEEARVENSSRPEFEKPALEAIRKWRFRPGMKEGQPVRTFIRIPMRFRVSTG